VSFRRGCSRSKRHHIEQDDVGYKLLCHCERPAAIASRGGEVAFLLKIKLKQFDDIGVVVDY
jgi:hypothetical protein